MFERIVQGGKSTIILLQVISMELYILITIKLCERTCLKQERERSTSSNARCIALYCSQVKDQLRSLLHSSMNFCRIIHENMLLNPKKISMCNQAWSQRDNPCNTYGACSSVGVHTSWTLLRKKWFVTNGLYNEDGTCQFKVMRENKR